MSGVSPAVGQIRHRSMTKRVLPLLATVAALLLSPSAVGAQAPSAGRSVVVHQLAQLRAERTLVPPKPVFDPSETRAARTNHARIVVTYRPGFSAAAKAAFQAAVNIWKTHVVSNQVIHIDASWKNLGANVLGQAGATKIFREPDNKWYAVALAEARCRCNLNGNEFEIQAEFNRGFPDWYFGTTGAVPNDKWDMESTVLHELGHGLGFFSTMQVSIDGTHARWGLGANRKTAFDAHEWSAATGGLKLAKPSNFPNDSVALKNQLVDGTVYFKGQHIAAVLGGQRARLYAPNPWEGGSSNSHFDEATYLGGTPNALMTPVLYNGESAHSPGPLTLALFQDIGWATFP
jgi:hypothetical protein